MATLTEEDQKRIRDYTQSNPGLSLNEYRRRLGYSKESIGRYKADGPRSFLPDPAPEAGGPELPDPMEIVPLDPLAVNHPGAWLVLGDLHMPMHDKKTIEAAVETARARNAVGVLLNGDVMDMFSISPFFRMPTRDRFIDELEITRQFLTWLKSRLPKARIIYRQGNHEFRLVRYTAERAAALCDLPELHLPAMLRLEQFGIEWVQDKRKVNLGKLQTLHGHELRKGGGVNPARFAFLRTTSTVLVSHHHQTSHHRQRSLDDKHFSAWSVGCACYIHAEYDPYNQWNHGFAVVDVAQSGEFAVTNLTVRNGRVE